MEYRKFGKTGAEVSVLGVGGMRFPTKKEDDREVIDQERSIRMIRTAIDGGVNYLDTAYSYHNGESEVLYKNALKDGYRKKVYIADKSPVWLIKKAEDFDKLLDEQLERLGVDSIDFYLLHGLDRPRFEELVKKFDLTKRMDRAKAEGKIKHLGFSFHDDFDTFKEIIDYYDGWEFCQIQYNYVDVNYQAGRKGLKYAADKGLGVVIMEPLRGGKLADVAPHLAEAFPEEKKPVEWAFDFLWDQPEVSVVLSGMSNEQQIEDNLVYADRSSSGMLSEQDKKIYSKAKKIFDTMALVGCTKCEYCMPCPSGIHIPEIFSIYNSTAVTGEEQAKKEYAALDTKADACVKCRQCEKACPQHIKVSSLMEKLAVSLQ